jgi:hypothetical protein
MMKRSSCGAGHSDAAAISGVALVVAPLALGVGLGLLFADRGHCTPAPSGNGYDFAPTIHAFFWTPIVLMMVGSLIATISVATQVVAWIGAPVAT